MNNQIPYESELHALLNGLCRYPQRSPQRTAIGRAAFLRLAQERKRGVSPLAFLRHIGWKSFSQTIQRRKEGPKMANAFLNILLVLSLVFGGTGIAAASAQNSQPDELLYPVKTFTEAVRTAFTTDPEAQFQLALQLTTRRSAELQQLIAKGSPLSERLEQRYQAQVQAALGKLDQLGPDSKLEAQLKLETQLKQQLQQFQQLLAQGGTGPVLQKSREMLQEQLRILNNMAPSVPQEGSATPAAGEQYENQNQNQYQGPMQTPAPGSGYGPGTGTCNGTCTGSSTPSQTPSASGPSAPGTGNGAGPGDGSGDGKCTGACTPTQNNYDHDYQVQTPQPGGSGSGAGQGGYGPGGKP